MRRDGRAAWREGLRSEDGSALLLMPAGVLILIILAAISVDAAILFQAQREVADIASGLANDGAGLLDEAAFYNAGTVQIDRSRVANLIALRMTAEQDDPLTVSCAVRGTGDPREVEVVCTGTTKLLFTPAVGPTSLRTVTATARARAESS